MLKEAGTQVYFKFWKRNKLNFYYSLINNFVIAEKVPALEKGLFAKLTTLELQHLPPFERSDTEIEKIDNNTLKIDQFYNHKQRDVYLPYLQTLLSFM